MAKADPKDHFLKGITPSNSEEGNSKEFEWLPSSEAIGAESQSKLSRVAEEVTNEMNQLGNDFIFSLGSDYSLNHASSFTLANTETSSLGILSVGNLSDFSEPEQDSRVEVPRKTQSNISEMNPVMTSTEHNFDDVSIISDGSFQSTLDFDKKSVQEKLLSLFGDDAEDVKRILEESVNQSSNVQNSSEYSSSLLNEDKNISDAKKLELTQVCDEVSSQTVTPPMRISVAEKQCFEVQDLKSSINTSNNSCSAFEQKTLMNTTYNNGDNNKPSAISPSNSVMETPLTKLLKKNTHAVFVNSDISSFENPFGDECFFDVAKLYTNQSDESSHSMTGGLCVSDVEFRAEQISARSSSISRAFDRTYEMPFQSTVKDHQKKSSMNQAQENEQTGLFTDSASWHTDLAYCTNLSEYPLNQDFVSADMHSEFSDSNFLNKEEALKMIQKEQESFEKKHQFEIGANDLKANSALCDFSVSDQPQCVDPPSWWSGANSSNSRLQLSVGQLIAAKTECLGSLSDNSMAEHPYFGMYAETPKKQSMDCSEFVTDVTKANLSKSETSDISDKDASSIRSLLSMESISQLIKNISLNDDSSAVVEKVVQRKLEKASRRFVSKGSKKLSSDVGQEEDGSSSDEASRGCDRKVKRNIFRNKAGSKMKETHKAKSKLTTINETRCPVTESDVTTNVSLPADVHQSHISKEQRQKHRVESKLDHAVASASHKECAKSCSHNLLTVPNEDADNGLSISSAHVQSDSESSGSLRTAASSVCSNPVLQCCTHSSHCHKGNSASRMNCSGTSSSASSHVGFPVAALQGPNNFINHRNPTPCCMSSVLAPGLRHHMPPPLSVDYLSCMSNYNVGSSFLPQQIYSSSQPVYSVPFNLPGGCVQGPNEFEFPRTYVGDTQKASLTLSNAAGCQLFFHLKLTSATCNKSSVPVDVLGLSLRSVVHCAGYSPFDVKITYTPTYDGETEVDLHVVPSHSPEPSLAYPVSAPKAIKIKLQAEVPQISLTSKEGLNSLQFQAVAENSSIIDVVTLENKGELPIPVVIKMVEQPNQSHSFSFAMNNSCVSGTVKCSSSSSKLIMCALSGCSSAAERRKFDIPVLFQAGKCMSSIQPEEVSATITVTSGTSISCFNLSTFQLSAVVGALRIHLKTYPAKDTFTLRAMQNSKVSEKLILVNSGTIPAAVDLAINPASDSLSVMPQTVILKPSNETTISVYFQPAYFGSYSGTLQAAVHSQDLVFDIVKINGLSSSGLQSNHHSNQKLSLLRNASAAPPVIKLECRKRFLAWNGVQLNESIVKQLTVRNPSQSEVFHAKIKIRENCQSFKLIEEGTGQEVSMTDMAISPRKCKHIRVVFCPTEKRWYMNSLILNPSRLEDRACFDVPLSGYGGKSHVTVVNLLEEDNLGYNLRLNSSHNYENVILYNTGWRAAFVKVVPLTGDVDNRLVDASLDVQPSEFVLLEKEKLALRVSYRPGLEVSTNKNCELLIYYGDEIMRQKLRSCGNAALITTNSLQSLNFNVPYLYEQNVPKDEPENAAVDWTLFYNSLGKITVNVKFSAENSSMSQTVSFSALSLVQDTVHRHSTYSTCSYSTLCHSPPIRDSANKVFPSDHSSVSNSCDVKRALSERLVEDWITVGNSVDPKTEISPPDDYAVFSVEPKTLTLDAESRDARVRIINHSENEIRFKLTWSVDIISASPVQGLIPSKSDIGIRVKPIAHFDGKPRDEVSECFIAIACCGFEKRVSVQVCNTQKCHNPSKTVKKFLSTENLALPHKQGVPMNENASGKSLTEMSANNKDIQSNQQKNVPANPQPRLASSKSLSQLPTIRVEKPPSSSKTEQSATSGLPTTEMLRGRNSVPSSSSKSRKSSLYMNRRLAVEPKVLEFPVTKPNGRNICSFTVKNWSEKSITITITKPELPFVIEVLLLTVKPGKYLKVPVMFHPQAPSSFRSVLSMKLENGGQVDLPLVGICAV